MVLSIPSRYRALLQPPSRGDVEALIQRSVAAMALSQLSTHDFIAARIAGLAADLCRSRDYFDAATMVKERELAVLRRQKKTIGDDITEVLSRYETGEEAYLAVLMTKIMPLPRGKRRKRAVEKAVLEFYGAARRVDECGCVERYCHVTGWWPEKLVHCVKLVPEALEGEELAYLLGVREAGLAEPRNGITLCTTIRDGLERGWIVIVPDEAKDEETVWRCVVVEQAIASHLVAGGGMTWKDIDGKALTFLTPNRPARRYLFLRYILTFLHQMRLGNTAWLQSVEEKGYFWGIPGPYLRESMLRSLARRFDGVLPEVFYESTFVSADGCAERSLEEEEDLAMALDLKMRDALVEKRRDEDEDEDEDYDDDEDWDGDSD